MAVFAGMAAITNFGVTIMKSTKTVNMAGRDILDS